MDGEDGHVRATGVGLVVLDGVGVADDGGRDRDRLRRIVVDPQPGDRLEHGTEGVHGGVQVEAHQTNTHGRRYASRRTWAVRSRADSTRSSLPNSGEPATPKRASLRPQMNAAWISVACFTGAGTAGQPPLAVTRTPGWRRSSPVGNSFEPTATMRVHGRPSSAA